MVIRGTRQAATRTRGSMLAAVIAALALLATACGGRGGAGQADDGAPEPGGTGAATGTQAADCPDESAPGLAEDTIRIGGIYPLSGPASAYGAIPNGVRAYFEHVNEEQGGAPGVFEGREIEFSVKDDGYSPPRAVEVVRELVEQEEVFALFQTLGTPSTTAIWDYVNEQEVPQLFVATGASQFGLSQDDHPWTIGWQPNYVSEARVYAQYLTDNHPDATVAALFQNDDYGLDYLDGFKDAIADTDIEIVAEESYETTDPTVESQMTNLAQSGADVFFNITTPSFAAQALAFDAQSDWDPVHLLNSVSNSLAVLEQVGFANVQDVVSAAYIKDAADAQWEGDEDMQRFLGALETYAPDADPDNAFHAYGWAVADSFYKVLERAQCPTREALMEAARNLDDVEFDLALPGITMTTDGDEDGFPLEGMQIVVFEGENFELQGDVIQTREVFGAVGE